MDHKIEYKPRDPSIWSAHLQAKAICAEHNAAPPEARAAILERLLGAPTDAYFEPPFFCDFGYNLKVGRNCFANHNFVVLDCALVTIGDDVMFGPNTVLSAASHATDPDMRRKGLEYALPITIGNNVWIGANVTVLPGVTIGDNCTIGAGSVVSKDIPANSIAVGNPCKVVKSC